jgi:hypothetical protein
MNVYDRLFFFNVFHYLSELLQMVYVAAGLNIHWRCELALSIGLNSLGFDLKAEREYSL